jgi:hypothetical protein
MANQKPTRLQRACAMLFICIPPLGAAILPRQFSMGTLALKIRISAPFYLQKKTVLTPSV